MLGIDSNVVQVEFFHDFSQGGEVHDLRQAAYDFARPQIVEDMELIFSGREDLVKGTGLKTVVRLYDEHNFITVHVQEYMALKSRERELRELIGKTRGIARWLYSRQDRRVSSKMARTQDLLETYIPLLLRAIVEGQKPLVKETFGHRFCSFREDEVHELLESVAHAKGMWVFVYEPNTLLADNVVEVGYMM